MKVAKIFGQKVVPAWAVLLAGFLLNGLLGLVDYYTGHDLVLSSFYVLPIGLVAWFAGPGRGVSTAMISAGILLTADIADGRYSRTLILGFNTLIRLGFFLIIVYIIVALRNAMRRQEESSRVDSLTGAANHVLFYEAIDNELERLGRYGHPLTLVYLDLDGFKAVNDGFGHLVGDKVLRLVAHCAKSRLRKTDVVARLGGDEFAFLFPETDEEAAKSAINEVVNCLGAEMRAGGWPVTFSIGVITCHEPPASGEALLKMADDLMYTVKLGTKDGVKYASLGCAHSDTPLCDEQTLIEARRD